MQPRLGGMGMRFGPQSQLEYVQGLLATLKTGDPGINADAYREGIEAVLKLERRDESALDPEGKKTRTEMRQELDDACRTCNINAARLKYEDSAMVFYDEKTQLPIEDNLGEFIRGKLRSAGMDASVLVPGLGATEVEARIDAKHREHHINAAHFVFDRMLAAEAASDLTAMEKSLRAHIKMIGPGADASVIYENDAVSAEQAEVQIRTIYAQQAQLIYPTLDPKSPKFEQDLKRVHDNLKRADIGAYVLELAPFINSLGTDIVSVDQALSPEMKLSGTTKAENRLNHLKVERYAYQAQHAVEQLAKGEIYPESAEAQIGKFEKMAAVIDPTDKAPFAAVRAAYPEAFKNFAVHQARRELKMLEGGFSINPTTTLIRIRGHLKDAGRDAAALDETGEKTAEEMEAHLEELRLNPPKLPSRQKEEPKTPDPDSIGLAPGDPMQRALAQYQAAPPEAGGEPASIPFPLAGKTSGRGAA